MPIPRSQKLNVKNETSRFEQSLITHYKISGNVFYKNAVEEILRREQLNLGDLYSRIELNYKISEKPPFTGPKNKSFTFIDLFAGIGGFRLALQKNGGECIFSSEWDDGAQKTYFKNYGEIPFGDITDPKIKKCIPKNFNILCAGFPCQPFSRAGVSARNFLGLSHGFDHPTQGNLFFDILEIASKHQPDVLFLENVKNLRSHDQGNTFRIIESSIRSIGYSFFHAVINASTEVPQKRERTYIVCFKNPAIDFQFPIFSGVQKTLKSILDLEVDEKFTISDKLWLGHQTRTANNLKRGVGFTAFLANIEKPANTLVARYGKDGKECLIPQLGKNPRKLTPRECARLQGYPEVFILPESSSPAYRQFGNSVAVPVIEKIAQHILLSLKNARKKSKDEVQKYTQTIL